MLESYALHITAVKKGSNLFMQRGISPNTVNMKNFRPFFCKGLRVQVFKAEERHVQKTTKAAG